MNDKLSVCLDWFNQYNDQTLTKVLFIDYLLKSHSQDTEKCVLKLREFVKDKDVKYKKEIVTDILFHCAKRLKECFSSVERIFESTNENFKFLADLIIKWEIAVNFEHKASSPAEILEEIENNWRISEELRSYINQMLKSPAAKQLVQEKEAIEFNGRKEYPEPILYMKRYEHILKIIKNMGLTIERTPNAYSDMRENHLRDHFLSYLNAQYEGKATGETFNCQGKTDILIRQEGKNIFIAECKFWRGKKSLIDAIDQLLGYTTWRDTKTAIIIFNRGRNFSSVLKKIAEKVKFHKCYKRKIEVKGETEFRYIFHQPDDPKRELILTIMAFNVPVPEKTDSD